MDVYNTTISYKSMQLLPKITARCTLAPPESKREHTSNRTGVTRFDGKSAINIRFLVLEYN
jgi:hypothetical protein